MGHMNIEMCYTEISSQEKACLLSIYWPIRLQRHVWGFISASVVGSEYLAWQNGKSHVLTCNWAFGGDSKTSWALPSSPRTTSLQAMGRGRSIIIFLNWQASQIVAKQHLTPYLLSQDWSVQRHLHKEVNSNKQYGNWLTKGYTTRTGMRAPIGP